MIRTRSLSLLAVFLGAFVLSACEEEPQGRQVVNRREVKPPPGEGGSGTACSVIRNRAPFTTMEHALDLVAYKNQDGWIYNASCQR